MSDEPFIMYTVYKNTRDFPGMFVCRRFEVLPDQVKHCDLLGASPTLDGIRKFLPAGLHQMDRFADDDPNIVEVWF